MASARRYHNQPAQLGITSGNAAPVTSKTPESRIGGDLEITLMC
jgi:hypothetical protein